MSIQLEFIDFIVPIATIKEKYPGGWEQCLKDHEYAIGGRIWYDEHLFRDGAMNSMDIKSLVDHWQSLGFITHLTNEKGEPTKWLDVCVEHLFRDGAMNSMDIKSLVDHWQSLGFITHVTNEKGEPTKWLDVCVCESLFGGVTMECDWIEYDSISGGAYLTGTEPGKLIGRKDFKAKV